MTALPDWINPWSANRRLRAQRDDLLAELTTVDRLAVIAADQYDRLREANGQLREALQMVREANGKLWAENSALLSGRAMDDLQQLGQQYDAPFSLPPEGK